MWAVELALAELDGEVLVAGVTYSTGSVLTLETEWISESDLSSCRLSRVVMEGDVEQDSADVWSMDEEMGVVGGLVLLAELRSSLLVSMEWLVLCMNESFWSCLG